MEPLINILIKKRRKRAKLICSSDWDTILARDIDCYRFWGQHLLKICVTRRIHNSYPFSEKIVAFLLNLPDSQNLVTSTETYFVQIGCRPKSVEIETIWNVRNWSISKWKFMKFMKNMKYLQILHQNRRFCLCFVFMHARCKSDYGR